MKLTDWFPAGTKPKRIGVYEVEGKDCDGKSYAFWNGKCFGMRRWFDHGVQDDDRFDKSEFNGCDLKWRGLAEKPE